MKRILVCLLVLTMANTSFSQPETKTQPTKDYYLKKYKSQKIAGFVCLGVGVTLLTIGAVEYLLYATDLDFYAYSAFIVSGSLAVIASIPLFIAAGKNKRRANKASAFIEMNRMLVVRSGFVASVAYPAIGIKLNLH